MEKADCRQAPAIQQLISRARNRLRHHSNPNQLERGRKKQQASPSLIRRDVGADRKILEMPEAEQELSNSPRPAQQPREIGLVVSSPQEEHARSLDPSDLKIYPFQDDQQVQLPPRTPIQPKRTPYSITDLMYLQGYKDVNPYLETLKELHNSPEEWSDRNEIEQLCYAGIGRSVVEVKKRSSPPYSRVNLLIRQFMMETMQDKVAALSAKDPTVVFVMCCKHSLGFRPVLENDRLKQLVHEDEYRQVVQSINHIIERNFLVFKKKKNQQITPFNKFSLAASVLGVALLLIALTIADAEKLMLAAWSLMILALITNVVGVFRSNSSLHSTQSIITTIQRQIEDELAAINRRSSKVQWRCGTDFYWLEVQPLDATEVKPNEHLETQQKLQ